MAGRWLRAVVLAGGALALAALVAFALIPQAVPVDVAAAGRGPLEVTVNEEARTRIREVYQVFAPIAGKVLRSPREVGDTVVKDQTILAVIEPGDPSFIDARRRRELEAAVSAAEAAVTHAQAEVRRARSELAFSEGELRRAESLSETKIISERTLDKARMEAASKRAALAEAEANLELQKRQLERAKAQLLGPEDPSVRSPASCCVQVRAPVDGEVLKVVTESEKVVEAGSLLIEIGDRRDLEIVVELLSTDAVRVEEGAAARVERWGGGAELNARVRRIEPAGFTKISALGIEEQRVKTILDLTDPPERWGRLGHDYRVHVRITVWRSGDVLRVPLSALFRKGEDWAVFTVADGRAHLTTVEIGHRNREMAEVISGLEAGERVILHPSDRVADGVRIELRESEEIAGG